MDATTTTAPVAFGRLCDAWRRALHGLSAGLTILCLTGCGAAPEPARWGVITIGGVTYRLPAMVYEQLYPPQGPQDSMFIELPLVAGANPFSRDDDMMQVLLVAPNTSDPRDRDRQVRQSLMISASVATSFQMDRKGCPLVKASTRAPDAPAGLVQVALDGSDPLYSDVFARAPLDAVTEYIACSRLGGENGAVQNPLCEQEFAGPGMTVKVTYRRGYLPQWDAIRRSTLDFLRSHRVA